MGNVNSLLYKRPQADMTSPQAEMVRDIIGSNRVVIFSKSYCPFCTLAKDQFRKLQVKPHVIELDGRTDGEEIQTILGEITGARTVPRCFIDGKFIGGGSDVRRLYDTGELQKLISNIPI